MKDAINPSHYQQALFIPKELVKDYLDAEGNLRLQYIELMQFTLTEEEFKGHLKGQIWKYLLRLGKKDEASQEAEKSSWYSTYLTKFLKQIKRVK